VRVEDIFESVRTSGVFYHGTNKKFTTFDVNAVPVNRATNVSGAYFTPSMVEAGEYGGRIIKVEINPRKPFFSMQKNQITESMVRKAKELLLKFTTYKEGWLDSAILPAFVERGNFGGLSDISGDIKRDILLAGGYDSYVDGRHVVILEPSQRSVKIVGEF